MKKKFGQYVSLFSGIIGITGCVGGDTEPINEDQSAIEAGCVRDGNIGCNPPPPPPDMVEDTEIVASWFKWVGGVSPNNPTRWVSYNTHRVQSGGKPTLRAEGRMNSSGMPEVRLCKMYGDFGQAGSMKICRGEPTAPGVALTCVENVSVVSTGSTCYPWTEVPEMLLNAEGSFTLIPIHVSVPQGAPPCNGNPACEYDGGGLPAERIGPAPVTQ